MCSFFFPALRNDICLCTFQDDRMKPSGTHLNCSVKYVIIQKKKLEFITQEWKEACSSDLMLCNFGAWNCTIVCSLGIIYSFHTLSFTFKCEKRKYYYALICYKLWEFYLGSLLINNFTWECFTGRTLNYEKTCS